MLLEVSFYVFELLFLGTHSYGQSGSSKCSEISRSSPWAPGSSFALRLLDQACVRVVGRGSVPLPCGKGDPKVSCSHRVGAQDPPFPTSPSIKCEGPCSGIRVKISGCGALRKHQGSTECCSIGSRAAGGREGIQAAQQW